MSIGKKFMQASMWAIAGNVANNIVSFLIFVILARLLDASSIGLVAFAIIFIDIGRVIVFGGLPEAIVQRKEWRDDVASVAFTANLICAFIFFLLMAMLISPWIAGHFRAEAQPVLAALAFIPIIDAARAVHEAKMRREFRYAPLALRMSVATAISGVAGIWLAIAGYGVWALVAQRFVNAILLTILSWTAAGFSPRFLIKRDILKELSGFIYHLTPARLLTVLVAKAAEFIVGLFLGPAAIAYYRVGARGLEVVAQLTILPIQQTALSAFSRLPDTGSIGNAYARVTRATALVACPVYLGAAVTAPDFVMLVFGPQWEPSAGIMSGLALAIGASSLGFFIQPALTAANRPGLVLTSTLGSFAATVVAALSAVHFGVQAVALSISSLQYALLPFRMRLMWQGLRLDWRDAMGGVARPFLVACLMAGMVYAIRVQWLQDFSLIVRFILSVLAGIIIYPMLLLVMARGQIKALAADLAPVLPQRVARLAGLAQPNKEEKG